MKVKILITQPRGKEHLVEAFEKAGAEVVNQLSEGVSLIIPTVDEELPFFARAKDYFLSKGIRVMVSSDYTIDMCRDKAEFFRFCRRHGFSTPETAQGNYIIKPRFGKASKGIIKLDRSFIVQEFIEGAEYSIDYFADWEGNVLSVIPRKRLDIVNGESTKADFNCPQPIKDIATRIGQDLRIVGHAVIQGFSNGENSFIVTEVNARFGGGSWLTFDKFNSPRWLVENPDAS